MTLKCKRVPTVYPLLPKQYVCCYWRFAELSEPFVSDISYLRLSLLKFRASFYSVHGNVRTDTLHYEYANNACGVISVTCGTFHGKNTHLISELTSDKCQQFHTAECCVIQSNVVSNV